MCAVLVARGAGAVKGSVCAGRGACVRFWLREARVQLFALSAVLEVLTEVEPELAVPMIGLRFAAEAAPRGG